MGQDTMR